jgi:hypothetical protein
MAPTQSWKIGLVAAILLLPAGCGRRDKPLNWEAPAEVVEERLYDLLRAERHFNRLTADGPRFAIWVRTVDGRKLYGFLFKHRDDDGNYDLIVSARQAKPRVDMGSRRLLLHVQQGDFICGESKGHFDDRIFDTPFSLPDAR